MHNRVRLVLFFTALVVFTNCRADTTAWDFSLQEAPATTNSTKIIFIGNSLTLHVINKDIGWDHEAGMAASSSNKDYAHLVTKTLGLSSNEAYIRNFYPFETDEEAADSLILSLDPILKEAPQVAVIQLADNVPRDPTKRKGFEVNYEKLLRQVHKNSQQMYCISSWWENPSLDKVIQRLCTQEGGHYVYIGDIFNDPNNTHQKNIDFKHPGVNAHPKDYGMNEISLRIVNAIQLNSN